MSTRKAAGKSTRRGRIPLQLVLVLATAVPVLLAGTLTAWLSLRNGENMVAGLVDDLQTEVSSAVTERIRQTLAPPHRINQLNQDLLDAGLLSAADHDQMQRHLHRQLRRFDSVGYIQLGLENGHFVGVERTADGFRVERTDAELGGKDVWPLDEDGARVGDPVDHVAGYQTTARTWYRSAVDAGEPTWSAIYQFSSRDRVRLGITAVQPWRGPDGEILGVLGTDIVLSQLGHQLRSARLREGGRVLVVERDGTLVAHSSIDPPFRIDDAQQAVRLQASEADDPLTRVAMAALGPAVAGLTMPVDLTAEFQGDLAFVHAQPIRDGRGIDWVVVVALPRVDYTPEIRSNTRFTLWLSLLTTTVALGISLLVSQAVSQPIHALVAAARATADGRWDTELPGSFTREIGELTDAFHRMRLDLQLQEASMEATTNRALEAQAAAEAANEAKTRFLANMSHELRTPLNAILGYAELLEEGDDGDAAADLARIREAGRHLLSLISDVLDLSRIEAGYLDLAITRVDAAQVASQTAEAARGLVESRGNRLEVEVPDGEVKIYSDEQKLRQCLTNLLGNAAKFTEGGRVTLKLTHTPSLIRFDVVDTGAGIPADRLEHIFAPFAQAGATGGSRPEGAGLGLAITREFAKALGGEVSVESEVGRGSRFTLTLPIGGPERATHTPSPVRKKP